MECDSAPALACAASAGQPDTLAALACALADTALADGDADAAIPQYVRALEIHESLEIPFERPQILIRGGVALANHGRRARRGRGSDGRGPSGRPTRSEPGLGGAGGPSNRRPRSLPRAAPGTPRTVDMHVRNILTKLRSRTRTEAASRVAELGLLQTRDAGPRPGAWGDAGRDR